jgi:hypothetical protein
MAVYKVIQDVEAEDKLVGFLTLRTFIYAIIAACLAYINFRLAIATQLGSFRWIVILLFTPPLILFGVLSLPLGGEQPTEVWLLSRLRFFIKPRIRVWNQSGVQDLVTITAPKKVERHLTKDITQTEVHSRLRALATTLDSRGWAVKNVAVNMNTNPGYLDIDNTGSDRLVGTSGFTQELITADVHASDDIMDEQNNPTAQHFEALMQKADATRKQEVQDKVKEATKDTPKDVPDFAFLDSLPAVDEEGKATFVAHKVISPGVKSGYDEDEDYVEPPKKAADAVDAQGEDFLNKMHETAQYVHAHAPKSVSASKKPAVKTVTDTAQTDKLKKLSEVAKNDKVSTLAQMAKHEVEQIKQIGPNEVEIDLHSH